MKITDLTSTRLMWMDIKDELIPLREINYQDVQIGDIFVRNPYWADEWTVIEITGKNIKDTESGRWSLGEELLTYDVYYIKDGEVVLDITGHNFPYQGLVKERWKCLEIAPPIIIALNYPGEILNSRTGN